MIAQCHWELLRARCLSTQDYCVLDPIERVESRCAVLSQTELSCALVSSSLHKLRCIVIIAIPIGVRFRQAENSKLIGLLSDYSSTINC